MHISGKNIAPKLVFGSESTKDSPAMTQMHQKTHEKMREIALQASWLILDLDSREKTPDEQVALVLLDMPVTRDIKALRVTFPHALFVGLNAEPLADNEHGDCDLIVNALQPMGLQHLLPHAQKYWECQQLATMRLADLDLKRKQIIQLTDIGLVLGAQVEPEKLLATILTEARAIANCDAGSLYLVDDSTEVSSLLFKLSQNDSIEFNFQETRIPLSDESLAGYVALSGKQLKIADAYQIGDSESYRFNRNFDEKHSYRTQSLMILPMRDHRDCVIGVIQFINRKSENGDIVDFDLETIEILRAVASQAAIAIQKTNLLNNINQLFESFVQASVKAIEQRDPSTSGHSFRVAETTTTLLLDLKRSNLSRFSDLHISDEHLREVRYAALLHDFGKVGVREAVLIKANKLSDDRLEALNLRFELKKEQLRRKAVEKELEMFHHSPVDLQVIRRRIHRDLATQLSLLDDYFAAVSRANMPSILPEGDFQHLQEIQEIELIDREGKNFGLITRKDLEILSIRKGSLTPEERLEIQNHVLHTKEFLEVLPWTPELAGVPAIAGAHHEKMNGTGYPLGLVGEEIPLASRVMAVCDIYDALTAMDRPYKTAMSKDAALRILDEEAAAGLLDKDLVKVFYQAQSWRVLDDKNTHTAANPLLATR